MGYSFIPVFLGNVFAGFISGSVYQQISDKVTITEKFANEKGLQMANDLSTNAYFEEVSRQANMTPQELTNLLWDTYNPSRLWMVIFAIGAVAALGLFIYDRVTSRQ
ncbi:Di-/tripeptide transporter [termite gut metagenome]|uniref:Di-/tripeptide transporter n=1 Tax=termite gut metagenome TaxID=433724 RepID=A0A5J4PUM8_9ZZZZ